MPAGIRSDSERYQTYSKVLRSERRNMSTKKSRQTRKRRYTEQDYDSNNGIMTSIWGPPTWHMLHCMSFNYPIQPTDADKTHYREFVESLRYVLPCGKCRKNLVKNFAKLPLDASAMVSRDTFSKYMFDLHEVVNGMLGKTSGLTYEEVRDIYEHFRARCAPLTVDEKGCVIPYYGTKRKCVLRIVPQTRKCKTFQM